MFLCCGLGPTGYATVDTDAGRVLFVSVYMPYDSGGADAVEAFHEELAVIESLLCGGEVSGCIVMGDFNADLRATVDKRFSRIMRDFFRANGFVVVDQAA